ncbi:MAG: cell envelope integrity protein TolA [Halioglobus sp.]
MSDSAYAKSPGNRIILRPLLATLALHAIMVFALTANWSGFEQKTIVAKTQPAIVNATLVDMEQFKPKPKPKPKTSPVRKKPVAKAAPKKVVPKPAPKKTTPKPQAKPKVEPKPEPRLTQEELAAITRSEMAQALAAEEEEMAVASVGELSASYASLIQQTVVNYWSRPPSARNGMETLLQIQLIPTGEVVSVTVLKGSGSSAFDRSAINAVEKAGSFPELRNLPATEFERTFRRFRLLFRPEDLRY